MSHHVRRYDQVSIILGLRKRVAFDLGSVSSESVHTAHGSDSHAAPKGEGSGVIRARRRRSKRAHDVYSRNSYCEEGLSGVAAGGG